MDSFFKALVFDPWFDNDRGLGPISRKSWELFWPEKPVVKLQSACFKKLTIQHAKFDGFEAQRSEDIEGIEAPETGPKSFGTFETSPWILKFSDLSLATALISSEDHLH